MNTSAAVVSGGMGGFLNPPQHPLGRVDVRETKILPNGDIALVPPHGLDAIRGTFGPITVEDGKITGPPGWEAINMKMVSDLPGVGKRLYINRAIEAPLRLALTRCLALHDGYVVQTIGCFAPRGKRSNPAALSMHSWGIAVDINAATNPMRNPMQKDIPDTWVAIFEELGWTWGGRFRIADPMHFQWASGA
jgi:hypothetical protein